MTEAQAIRRHPRAIERELEARRHHFNVLRELAAEFAACDVRPFVINTATMELEYTREIAIPDNLRAMLTEEAEAIHALTCELLGVDSAH